MLNVYDRNSRAKCEICSELRIKTPEPGCQWRPCGAFILNFEHISHHVIVFVMLTLHMELAAGNRGQTFWKYLKIGEGGSNKTGVLAILRNSLRRGGSNKRWRRSNFEKVDISSEFKINHCSYIFTRLLSCVSSYTELGCKNYNTTNRAVDKV